MSIEIQGDKTFLLNTDELSYSFEIDNYGLIRHLYFGKKIEKISDFACLIEAGDNGYHPRADRTMEECSSFGMMRYKETSLKVRFADGVRDFRYQAAGFLVEENRLIIRLKDEHYPFQILLTYEVFEEDNIIKCSRRAENTGTDKIVLERLYSMELGLQGNGYEIINYNGEWAAEFQMFSERIDSGKKVYESLRGTTGHGANPSFIIHKGAGQVCGDVYYGVLEYSGNFKLCAEALSYGYLNVLLGISDTDFAWVLEGGESFDTPSVYLGYSDKGFEKMSNTIHSFARKHIAPAAFADKPLKVLYNSWYATEFQVNCEDQKALAERAAKVGAELFVVDDGWFIGRNDDNHALGDWETDMNKFPQGLESLIEHVNGLGMGFGLWIEPEMVNEHSRLYQEHPDWVYQYPNREVLKGRNQYVLNLTKEEVVDFMIDFIDRLLTDYKIDYIKWDMNRPIGETGILGNSNDGNSVDKMKEIWVRHIRNFYRVIDTCRKRHANVEFEACASGGARVDYGAMRYFDEYWPSDNADALDRLYIQEAYSYLYPIKYMRAWSVDTHEGTRRQIPQSFIFHSAMCGSLGIGNDLNRLSDSELQLMSEYVNSYKRIREVVQFGSLHRLCSLSCDEIQAVQYVNDNKSVLFVFLVNPKYGKTDYRVRLRGLKDELDYTIRSRQGTLVKSGAFLMNYGLDVQLQGDYDSQLIELHTLIL